MIYQAYQAHSNLAEPFGMGSKLAAALLSEPSLWVSRSPLARNLAACCELLSRGRLTHKRPQFGIATVLVGNREVEVEEEVVDRAPFCSLLHFKKAIDTAQPRVLLVAPMSGHFATLLRGTVTTLLPDHDVYITDWHNARDVPLKYGRFDLDDFVAYLIRFLEVLDTGTHLLAICQPCVAALTAVAIMAEDGHPAQPRSMTLMAGPIDTRVNPTAVNRFALSRPIEWFESTLVDTVPLQFSGALRRVYPGFLQLLGFMSMNLERHVKAHANLFDHLLKGEVEQAEVIRKFYDEYFAVMDLPADFFIQTVRLVFQEHALPLGRLKWRGRPINTHAIRRTALLTVEGERDDICSVGQTVAAQDLCDRIRPYMKVHHVQTGVGHYGVFSGRRWTNQIYPVVRDLIHNCD